MLAYDLLIWPGQDFIMATYYTHKPRIAFPKYLDILAHTYVINNADSMSACFSLVKIVNV